MTTPVTRQFVIVGAGPVGLWTAIQLKKRMPGCDVVLYERYTEYQRQHILKLQHSSMFFGADNSASELDGRFFQSVFGRSRLQMRLTRLSKSFVSTQTIESGLREWVLSLGCDIRYQPINSLSSLKSAHPEASALIVANGAHSELRTELLGEDAVEQSTLQSVVELKFRCPADLWRPQKTASLEKLHHLAFEYCGKELDGRIPVSLRIFVPDDVYEGVPSATFKSPLQTIDTLPEVLERDIRQYAQLRHIAAEQLMSYGGLTKLQLSVYKAKRFSHLYDGTPVFLVGDAAMGVPYFRALNCGLVLASRLAWLLRRVPNAAAATVIYNRYRPVHVSAEFALAAGKNHLLNTYDTLRKMYKRLGHVSLVVERSEEERPQ